MTRKRLVLLTLVVLAAALAIGLGLSQAGAPQAHGSSATLQAVPASVQAYDYVAALSDQIGPRVYGKAGEQKAAAYITSVLQGAGYTVTTQDFTVEKRTFTRSSQNIIAEKTGTDPNKRIVIGAHYDSVAAGRGAFDNATGVALLLTLAVNLESQTTPYTIEFVAFGAEEPGMVGSQYFVDNWDAQQKADTMLMVNFDSVATGDQVYCYSSAKQAWPQLTLRQMARAMGATILTNPGLNSSYPYGTTGDWSDHYPFQKAGIPYLYFEATNWLLGDKDGYVNTTKDGEIWHTKKDTISYIEQRYPGRMAEQLQTEYGALTTFLTSDLTTAAGD